MKPALPSNKSLTSRQKSILFAVVKEYCDYSHTLGSVELKNKYGFEFSSATIRNELVKLRDKGYLYQPFTNSSSKPTEKAFKMFINQLIVGLQVTSRQQKELKRQIQEMEEKQANLSKEISRLLALTSGGVGFSVSNKVENYSGIRNLLEAPSEGKVVDILDFLDNLDAHKKYLLQSEDLHQELADEAGEYAHRFKTIIGGEHPVIPLGKGYAMVATNIYLDNGEKAVVGVISPIHILAKKKNLAMIENLSEILGKSDKKN